MSDELKPCPFCGEPGADDRDDEYTDPVTCDNENCIMWPHFYTVEQWNTRPIEDELMERLDVLTAQLADVTIVYCKLMNYRHNNTLNFQLEKLDDYLRELNDALEDKKNE